MSVTEQPFGQTADGTKETLLTCTNASGNQVKLTTYGARIVAVTVPDKAGKRDERDARIRQVRALSDPQGFLGTTTGRYANRIAKGKFELDGNFVLTLVNNGPNALHGGLKGFDKQHWTYKTLKTADATGSNSSSAAPTAIRAIPAIWTCR